MCVPLRSRAGEKLLGSRIRIPVPFPEWLIIFIYRIVSSFVFLSRSGFFPLRERDLEHREILRFCFSIKGSGKRGWIYIIFPANGRWSCGSEVRKRMKGGVCLRFLGA